MGRLPHHGAISAGLDVGGEVDTMNDLRVRVIETVMAAVRIAQYRAAAAHAVGNEAEADRFETEVREAEQRLARLRGFKDQLGQARYDYLS